MRNLNELTNSQRLYRSRSYLDDYAGFLIHQGHYPDGLIQDINWCARALEKMAERHSAREKRRRVEEVRRSGGSMCIRANDSTI